MRIHRTKDGQTLRGDNKPGKGFKMKNLVFTALVATFLLVGCGLGGDGFKRAYKGYTPQQLAGRPNIETCSSPVVQKMGAGVSKTEIMDYLTKNGYQYIGESNFGGLTKDYDPVWGWDEKDAIKHGQELGACIVLYAQDFKKTNTVSVPVTTPTTATATAYTPSGTVTARAYGTQTDYIPMNMPVHGFVAIYGVKVKKGVKPIQECTTTLGVTECNNQLP